MTAPRAPFLRDYAQALERHVRTPSTDSLAAGHELGRRALVEGISLLDLTENHFRTVQRWRTATEPEPVDEETALEFLLQTLITLDVATRGYLDGTRRYEQQRSRADDLAGRDEFRTALMESLQDGFFLADEHGTIIEVNSAFGELTGYGAEDVPYQLPHPWLIPEGPRYPRLGVEPLHFVTRIRHRDGRDRWLAVSTSSLTDPESNRRVFVGTIRDITAEHDAQARDQAVSQLATAVAAATSVAEVLEVGLGTLRHAVGAHTAVAAVWDTRPGAPTLFVSSAEEPEQSDQRTDLAAHHAAGTEPLRTLLERTRVRPVRTLAATGADTEHPEGIAAPLGETGDAALWLGFPAPRIVDTADWTLFSLLISHLSLAVQRAHNFDQARATSLTLQRAMLGPIDLPPRFWVHYEPALPPLEIGGDWYDVVALRDGLIGIVVGDCVGRGLSAAVVMGQLRTAARALLLREAGPAQLLTELDAVAAQIPGAMCTTVCAAVLDPVRGELRYSNAGHMPPIAAPADQPGLALNEGRAVPLATFAVPHRPEATVQLSAGSTLVLFTDGLVEQRGVDLIERFAAIGAVLRDCAHLAPRAVADAVLSRLCPPGGYDDDVAMVVYRQPPADWRVVIPAEADQLTGMRSALRRWLTAAAVPATIAADLVAAANEACSNSMEHAYQDTAEGQVTIVATCGTADVVIEVSDTGVWKPLPDDPGPRGRGIDMMRTLTDQFEIEHHGPGTRVRLSVTLPAITFGGGQRATWSAPAALRMPANPTSANHGTV